LDSKWKQSINKLTKINKEHCQYMEIYQGGLEYESRIELRQAKKNLAPDRNLKGIPKEI